MKHAAKILVLSFQLSFGKNETNSDNSTETAIKVSRNAGERSVHNANENRLIDFEENVHHQQKPKIETFTEKHDIESVCIIEVFSFSLTHFDSTR